MKKIFSICISAAVLLFTQRGYGIELPGFAKPLPLESDFVGLIADPVTGMEFVFVKGGCFQMGDTFGDGESNEKPVHEVCVDDFYIGKYDVTVGEFRKFSDDTGYRTEAEKDGGCEWWTGRKWEKDSNRSWRDPGFSQDDSYPVVCVSWNDSVAFKEWLSKRMAKRYRFSTEAEWEYAARIGLYDKTGNMIWEWVEDWYGEKYYSESPRDNPKGPISGQSRVVRGYRGRTASRFGWNPNDRTSNIRVRLVRTQ